jgi:hypothetical protein
MRSRIRQLKPELFLDDEFWALQQSCPELPVLQGFLGLWCQADREGRFEWKPAVLRTQILPFWAGDFGEILALLQGAGLIQSYTVDGRRYGFIRSFAKHQRPNSREPKSSIPDPPESAQAESVSVHARAQVHARPDSPLPIPDPKPDPEARALPDVPGLAKVLPGHLPPSRRERDEAARDASPSKLRHKYTPGWRPTKAVNLARAVEIGLTEEELWQRWDEVRDKRYDAKFDDDEGQFNRELAWFKRDKEKLAFQRLSQRDRDAFEMPGKERRA